MDCWLFVATQLAKFGPTIHYYNRGVKINYAEYLHSGEASKMYFQPSAKGPKSQRTHSFC